MPNNNYTVGRDVQLVIATPRGILNPQKITEFTARQTPNMQKVEPIDGTTDRLRFEDGWEGDFSCERQSDALDAYVAAKEQGYFDGEDEPPCQILETITERGGGISQYRYEGVVLGAFDAGSVKGKETRKQKLSYECARRVKLL